MSLLTERKCTAYVCSEAVRPQEVFHPCFFKHKRLLIAPWARVAQFLVNPEALVPSHEDDKDKFTIRPILGFKASCMIKLRSVITEVQHNKYCRFKHAETAWGLFSSWRTVNPHSLMVKWYDCDDEDYTSIISIYRHSEIEAFNVAQYVSRCWSGQLKMQNASPERIA